VELDGSTEDAHHEIGLIPIGQLQIIEHHHDIGCLAMGAVSKCFLGTHPRASR
jgi:hypothetical protein